MNIRHLETFSVLSKHLSFTKAAEELFISQPAISRQISSLESEFGCTLFERNRRVVKLTRHGEAFLKYADRMLKDHRAWLKKIDEINRETHICLSVGFMNYLCNKEIMKTIEMYSKANKGLEVNIIYKSPPALLKMLQNEELNLGFTLLHPEKQFKDLQVHMLEQHEMKLAVNEGHPLAGSISPVDLNRLSGDHLFCISSESNRMAYEHVQMIMKSSDFKPGKISYSSTTKHVFANVIDSGGITFCVDEPGVDIPENIVLLPFINAYSKANVSMVWNKKSKEAKTLNLIEKFLSKNSILP